MGLSQESTLSDWKERAEVLLDLGMSVTPVGAWSPIHSCCIELTSQPAALQGCLYCAFHEQPRREVLWLREAPSFSEKELDIN